MAELNANKLLDLDETRYWKILEISGYESGVQILEF